MTHERETMRDFEGRVALITGGSSGIGRAATLAFARRGARVVVAARGEERGRAVVREVEEAGGKALFVATDVSRATDVERLLRETVDRFGRLDAAVNNAAADTGVFHTTVEFDEEEFDRTIAVNLKGVWLCMKHEIRQILGQEPTGGALVNVSSVNGLGAAARGSIYSASKAGVLALTKAAALEYAQAGVRVNALVPGAIDTPMLRGIFDHMGGERAARQQYELRIPVARIGRPEEAADAIVWLCSEAASYVTGHSFIVDGGMTAPYR